MLLMCFALVQKTGAGNTITGRFAICMYSLYVCGFKFLLERLVRKIEFVFSVKDCRKALVLYRGVR